jgi:urease accessory protein
VRANARLVAGPGGPASAAVLSSDPPLELRRAADAVYLAQGAAGPLGGDRLELDVEVPAGRWLRVRAVAATLALPSRCGRAARVELRAHVGPGACLDLLLEPVVAADGAWVELVTDLELAAGARLLWREEVVLGRYGERGGRVTTRVDVNLDGRPLLRTGIDLCGNDPVTRAASTLGTHRAFGSLLMDGHGDGAPPAAPDRSVAELVLQEPGRLLTVAADSALDVRRRLDERLVRLRRPEAISAPGPGPARLPAGNGARLATGSGGAGRPGPVAVGPSRVSGALAVGRSAPVPGVGRWA